jgi:mono/diheme cytochrome c family protein
MRTLLLTIMTMSISMAACADQDREQKQAAQKPAATDASKPTQVAEAPKPTQVAEAPKSDAAKPDAAKPTQVAAAEGAAPYKASEDGKKVDAATYEGYAVYTNVCVPCHGRDATGGMGGGANLIESMKKLSKDEVINVILNGKPGTLMAGFKTDEKVAKNVENIYNYLKGRSDGKIWGKSLDKM